MNENADQYGTLEILGGSYTINDYSFVGYGSNSVGRLIMKGGLLKSTSEKRALQIGTGVDSRGYVTLEGGTIDYAQNVLVGNNTGAIGTLKFDSGKILTTNGTVRIGAAAGATGVLEIGDSYPDGLDMGKILFGVKDSIGILRVHGGEWSSLPDRFPNDGGGTAIFDLTEGAVFTNATTITIGKSDRTTGIKAESGTSFNCNGLRLNGMMEIEGGAKATFNDNAHIGYNNDCSGVLTVSGGEVVPAKQLVLGTGSNSTAKVVLSDGGSIATTSNQVLFNLADDSSSSFEISDGAMLKCRYFAVASSAGSGTARVIFDGGKFVCTDNTGSGHDIFPAHDNLTYELGTNGLDLTTLEKSIVIGGVLTGVGGLTYNGSQSLTFNAQPTYTGVTEVKASAIKLGSFSLPGGIKLNGGNVEYDGDGFPGPLVIDSRTNYTAIADAKYETYGYRILEGGKLVVALSSATVGATETFRKVQIPDGGDITDYVFAELPDSETLVKGVPSIDEDGVLKVTVAERELYDIPFTIGELRGINQLGKGGLVISNATGTVYFDGKNATNLTFTVKESEKLFVIASRSSNFNKGSLSVIVNGVKLETENEGQVEYTPTAGDYDTGIELTVTATGKTCKIKYVFVNAGPSVINENPVEYSYGTSNFELIDPVYGAHEFLGWTGPDGNPITAITPDTPYIGQGADDYYVITGTFKPWPFIIRLR